MRYFVFNALLKGIIIFRILAQDPALATDFGVIGQTFGVAEEPFIEMLKKRLDKIDLEKEKQKTQAVAKERVENPQAVSGINPATKDRVFYFDPSYTLKENARLPCGKILHKAGTKVNPLSHINLSRRLFFIDARSEEQVAWLKERLNNPLAKQAQKETVEDRVILVGGSVFKLQELLGKPHASSVYFDQAGELTTKFGIKASPAIVEQGGLMLKIEEIVIKQGGNYGA